MHADRPLLDVALRVASLLEPRDLDGHALGGRLAGQVLARWLFTPAQAKPIHVLVPSVTARGIVNMTALAAAQANGLKAGG